MDKESFFIKQISHKNEGFIGDDGVFVDGFVYSKDAFFENVHFKRGWLTLKQIAYKSIAVNISDAIVSGAVPKYILLCIAIPKTYSHKQIKELADGFNLACKEFNIKLIGGDTISNDKLDISITIISTCKKHINRTGVKVGDLVAYSGNLGNCLKDLSALQRGKSINKNSKFIRPIIRSELFFKIKNLINSAMDISDGLFSDLDKLSKRGRVGFEFLKQIDKKEGISGEEYEILFTFNPKYKNNILGVAKKHKVDINIFAKAIRGRYKFRGKGHHF